MKQRSLLDGPRPDRRVAGWDPRNHAGPAKRVGDGHDRDRIAAARAKRRRRGIRELPRVLELNRPT